VQITNCGRGIHKREVKGIDRFKSALPNNWYAFTNLDLALGMGSAREIDLIIVSERRIFIIDIKDLHGRIESADGRWLLNDKDFDASPVAKINDNARNIFILLKQAMAKRPESKSLAVPKIEGLVVLTGKADRSGIAETELAKVLNADEFLASVANDKTERSAYGNVHPQFLATPLTEPVWKDRLTRFFNAGPNSLCVPKT
jgi:hypothetical protein